MADHHDLIVRRVVTSLEETNDPEALVWQYFDQDRDTVGTSSGANMFPAKSLSRLTPGAWLDGLASFHLCLTLNWAP